MRCGRPSRVWKISTEPVPYAGPPVTPSVLLKRHPTLTCTRQASPSSAVPRGNERSSSGQDIAEDPVHERARGPLRVRELPRGTLRRLVVPSLISSATLPPSTTFFKSSRAAGSGSQRRSRARSHQHTTPRLTEPLRARLGHRADVRGDVLDALVDVVAVEGAVHGVGVGAGVDLELAVHV